MGNKKPLKKVTEEGRRYTRAQVSGTVFTLDLAVIATPKPFLSSIFSVHTCNCEGSYRVHLQTPIPKDIFYVADYISIS